MRKLFFAFLLILLAVWIGFLIHKDSGYILIAYGGYTIETSLWVGLICLILLFLIIYGLIRLTKHTASIGGRYQKWDKRRKGDKARELTNKGLCDLAEGNWDEARANLDKAAKHHPNPLINHLAAARAAHAGGNYDARDEHLRHAHESTKGAAVAVGLTQATLQMEGKQWEQGLATLNHLNSIAPNHKHITKLLSDVYFKLKDWKQLKALLPQLKRTKLFTDLEHESIDKQIHMGLLHDAAKSGDIAQLHDVWNDLPRKWRSDAQAVKAYTDYLIQDKDYEHAAELIAKFLKKAWNVELVNNYGLAPTENINKQISVAEHWLDKHPGEAELLLCIGRLCLKGNLLGRAEHVLQSCVAASPLPEAYIALGQTFEALDKPTEALATYKKALMSELR